MEIDFDFVPSAGFGITLVQISRISCHLFVFVFIFTFVEAASCTRKKAKVRFSMTHMYKELEVRFFAAGKSSSGDAGSLLYNRLKGNFFAEGLTSAKKPTSFGVAKSKLFVAIQVRLW